MLEECKELPSIAFPTEPVECEVVSLPSPENGPPLRRMPQGKSSFLRASPCVAVAVKFFMYATATAKSLQSCPTLCDPIDGSPPGSPVPGILQARTLEWVAISFSNAWRWKVKVKSLSRVRLWVTPWTAAYRAPPSMGFSRQEYWSWVPSPSPPPVLRDFFTIITLHRHSW